MTAVEVPRRNKKTIETGVYQWIPQAISVGSPVGRREEEVASQDRIKPDFFTGRGPEAGFSSQEYAGGTFESGSRWDTGLLVESGFGIGK